MQIVSDFVSDFDEESIQGFIVNLIQTQSPSGSTINKYIYAIKKYCDFVGVDWAENIKKVKEKSAPKILLSEEESEAFIRIDPPPSKYGMFWMCLYYSGARPSEIANLDVDSVDLSQKVYIIKESKTGRGRTIPIVEPVIPCLKDYLSQLDTYLLFPTNGKPDKPVEWATYSKDFKKRIRKLGIKKNVKPYSFRHSLITRLLGNGANLFDVQNIVGHRKADTTAQYYQYSLKSMVRAINRDTAVTNKVGGKALIQKIIEDIGSYNLEDAKDIDYSEIQVGLSHFWKAIKQGI